MKWLLVVLIGGVSPIATDVTFEKLSDCLAAEQELRQKYAAAFDAWSQQTATLDSYDRRRRRDVQRVRELDARRFANTGTCIPHAGTDQPVTPLNGGGPSPSSPQTSAPASSPAR
jgi:hypothetical protein